MKKNHFMIPYYGNKRTEVEKIYNEIDDIDKYKTIVEPFCGTSAFSYYVWLNNKDKNLTYVLNDNNAFLIELYSIVKNEAKANELYEKLCKLNSETDTKEKYKEVCKKVDTDLLNFVYCNKVYNIRPCLYPTCKKFTNESFKSIINAPIIEFLRTANIKLSCKDALEVYKEYKSDKKALIFLDPPYLASENCWYKDPSVNIYEYLFENDILKEKALIILCLENNWIIKLLFKGKKSVCYEKKYETTKIKKEHIIILNKKST